MYLGVSRGPAFYERVKVDILAALSLASAGPFLCDTGQVPLTGLSSTMEIIFYSDLLFGIDHIQD